MDTPLIDAKPTYPSTILTALTEATVLTEETGQQYTIITFDQQLYKIIIMGRTTTIETCHCQTRWHAFSDVFHWMHRKTNAKHWNGGHTQVNFLGSGKDANG